MMARHNPLPVLVWTILGALGLGIIALALVGLDPSSLGSLIAERLGEQVYAFEHLVLTGDYLELEIQHGHIVPVLRSGQEVGGTIVLGKGSYLLQLPDEAGRRFRELTGLTTFEDGFQALYLPLDYQGLEDLKALACARQVEDGEVLARAAAILRHNLADPNLLRLYGVVRRFWTGPTSLGRLHGYGYPEVFYSEGETVRVLVPCLGTGGDFQLPRLSADPGVFAAPRHAPLVLPVTFGVFAISALLFLAVAYALTADLEGVWRHPPARLRLQLAVVAGMAMVEVLGRVLARRPGLWGEGLLYLGLAGLTLLHARREGWRPDYLGFTTRNLGRAALAGGILGTLMVLGGALALPDGLRPGGLLGVAALAGGTFLGSGLFPQIYYRGLLHNTLDRMAGGAAAVAATAWFAGLARASAGLLAGTPPTAAFWAETLLAVPVAFLVTGYLFQRTRNLMAPATAMWLLAFLPQALSF